jgi:DNA-binding LytR/AlgR family response regulator
MKITAISIDDELAAHQVIEHHVSKIDDLELIETFTSPFKALGYLRDHDVDLLFLDINMPDIDGMTLLKTLKSPPAVIFTTAYDEYAVESYDFQASGYLLKPIGFSKFYRAVMRVLDQKKASSKTTPAVTKTEPNPVLILKSGSKMLKLDPDRILFIEASGNYAEVVQLSETVLVDHTLSELQEQHLSSPFVRIHRSYIVNMNHLQEYESHLIKVNNQHVPVGKTYRASVKEYIRNLT